MKIRIRESHKISIVDIQGRIDINASEVIETIGWLLKNRKKDILLNFDNVEFVDYSGISILAIAYKNVINHKGKMKFCNVAIHIEELFKLVRLDSIFKVYQNEDTALRTYHYESSIDKKQLRRRFKRLDVHIEVEFCSKRDFEKPKNTWHTGKLLNISGDGLFLYTKKLLKVETEVVIKVDLRDKKPFQARGIIIWLADRALQPHSYPGMGLHFKDITKRDQDRILIFINRHLTHRSSSL